MAFEEESKMSCSEVVGLKKTTGSKEVAEAC
jgi:hypothetical protein